MEWIASPQFGLRIARGPGLDWWWWLLVVRWRGGGGGYRAPPPAPTSADATSHTVQAGRYGGAGTGFFRGYYS